MRLAYGINYNQSYASIFESIINSEEENLVNKVTERIEFYIDYENYLLNSLFVTNSLLYKAVLRKIVELDINTKKANINNLLPKFENICSINNLDPQIFIKDLNAMEKYNFDEILIKSLPNYYFEQAKINDCELAVNSIKLIVKHFNSLTKEEWKDIFNNLEGKEIKLLKILNYNEWNSYSLEALKELLVTIAKSSSVKNVNILNDVIASFEASSKDLTNAFKDVRDEFISNRNMNPELFLFFSKWLFKYSSLNERSGEVIRTIFKTELLDNEECVNVLFSKAILIKDLIKKSSISDSSDLKEGIRDRIENEKISELGKQIDIN